MATLTLTISTGTNPKPVVQGLAKQLTELAHAMSDNATGGNTVLTFDNSPSNGTVSVQITSGPQSSGKSGELRRA